MALRTGSNYLSTYCMTWISSRVVRDMQIRVLEKLHSLSPDYSTNPLSATSPPISRETPAVFLLR